ncbi:disease resistance protein RPV1-like [Rosa chinensis]|uniref:disease resistance protein RPV1-like n=1 Tax=Rosa chinensis TaxID=74649 RepID=UPI001AD9222A|nr:disease resistance protein RPV1-like [Rosa chinensis]
MAVEAASSSSSSFSNSYTYDVFLSFRGEDTRCNFTDHLYNALRHKGINTFRDDKLPRGGEISVELVKAIEESRVSIIIFSENYASSRWCLDELVKILQCRASNKQMVRPVFYKVDPSDVRNQRGSFGEAFAKLDQCRYKDSIGKWREALSEAANLSGWLFSDGEYESLFIGKIAEELSSQVLVNSDNLMVAKYPIGIDSCRQDVHKLLHMEENNVRMVGIWGPGGIGKTTIAKAVFNSIRGEFEGSCFLANVRSNSSVQKGLAHLQQILLFDILGDSTLEVHNVDEGICFIRKRMQYRKVLLIIDDVSDSNQLDNLVRSSDCFGPGSRIIITTRDKHLLIAHQVQSIYEVKMLNDAEAMELFSWNAFNCNGPPDDFVELANRAVRYAQGLPLALIVVGRHLFARRKEHWDDALDSYKRVPHKNIQDILKISFDALEEDYVKELFLDIACFFKGEDVHHVITILVACDRNPVIGIEILKEKALITMDGHKIMMHDLIEEMGRELVRQQGEPGERSRLWNFDDVYHVLTANTGTKKIKGIRLKWEQEKDEICLNSKSFSRMKNLKYLSISKRVQYFGNIDHLSNELRWLYWYGCPIQSFPSNFHPRKLVVLKIPYSPRITRLWEGLKNFPILTSMNLEGCKSLRELPNFTGIPNLEELNLYGCESLVEVHQSVGCLDKLVTLCLEGCNNLVKLPSEISLKSLHAMDLKFCTKLEEFPKIIGKMDSLRELILSNTLVKELHPSIGNLIGLRQLYLDHCQNLTTLPCSIYELQNLEILKVSGFSKFVTFPKFKGKMNSLKELYLRGCYIEELHPSIGNFTGLNELNLADCKNLTTIPCSIYELQNLEILDVSGCSKLVTFPTKASISHDQDSGSLALPKLRVLKITGCNLSTADFIGSHDCLETLNELDLSSNSFVNIPALGKFVSLPRIDLYSCTRLREIPELPPNILEVNAGDCKSLERFLILPKSLNMVEINLWNCHRFSYKLGYDMEKMENILLNNQVCFFSF